MELLIHCRYLLRENTRNLQINQSQFGDDLEQIHIFFLISKKQHPREKIALEQWLHLIMI